MSEDFGEFTGRESPMTPKNMTTEERAEILTPCWQPLTKNCLCPMHLLRPLIWDAIKSAESAVRAERDRAFVGMIHRSRREGFRAGAESMRERAISLFKPDSKRGTIPLTQSTGLELMDKQVVVDKLSTLPLSTGEAGA